MKTTVTRFGLIALALALCVPGVASAQSFTCPVPVDFNADGGFDFSAIIQASITTIEPIAEGTTADIWPGEVNGYADFDDLPDARDDVPLGVWNHLIQAIISDGDLAIDGQMIDVHDVVCSAFAGTANLLEPVGICASLPRAFNDATGGGVAKASSAALLLGEDLGDIADALETGYTNGGFPCPGKPADELFLPFLLGGAGNLFGDEGDVDADGDTNLEEWQAAVDANPADFVAARNEFIATTLAGTSIIISVSGDTQLLVGAPASTYTAITIDPETPGFTETYTWSSSNTSVVTINPTTGVATAVGAGNAVITATGNTTAATGTRSVTVRFPKWFELCDFDNDLLAQGALLAAELGCDLTLGLTNDFNDYGYDLDAILAGAAPTPDAFQMALLAYTLCAGDNGPDQADALTAHATNVAIVEQYNMEAAALRSWTAPTYVVVSASPGSLGLTVGGSTATLSVSTEDQDEMPVMGTYTFVSTNPAIATVNGGAVAAGVVGATGVTVAAVAEGSATIQVFHEATGAQDNVGVSVDDTTTSNVSFPDPGDLNVGASNMATATTVGGPNAGETFTIMSSNAAVVTVNGGASAAGVNSVTLAGLTTGSATITATGTDSGLMSSFGISVKAGTACDSAKAIGDAGDDFPTSGPLVEIATAVGMWNGGAMAEVQAAEGAMLLPPGTTAAISGGFATLAGQGPALVGGLFELLAAFEALDSVSTYVAGNLGISSEMAGATAAVLGADVIFATEFSLPGSNLFNIDNAPTGVLFQVSAGWGQLAGNIAAVSGVGPNTAALAAAMADDTLLSPPTITPITAMTSDIVGSVPTKVPGLEPLDGGSVFAPGVNPMDLTNEEIADAVIGAQGDEFDFVNIAAGLDLFAAGSPFLPAAGALGLGVLAGALAFATAMRLRRRNA